MYRVAATLLAAVSLAATMAAYGQQAKPTSDVHTGAVARANPAPENRNCLRSTGSLIPPKPGQCLPVAGRSYSQQDLRRTGALNTADALGQLDPAITVHGH